MDKRLKDAIDEINDKNLKEKILKFIEFPSVEIQGKKYEGMKLTDAPASISHHHNYAGGLIEHIVATSKISLNLCDIVERVYGGKVNRDIVLSGIILHDLFKSLAYVRKENGSFKISPLAEQVDHLTLIATELIRRGFPLEVIHVVLASHGKEFGPIGPHTIEALICHLSDFIDSRLNEEILRAAKFIVKEATGQEIKSISSRGAFRIVREKSTKGWKQVAKEISRILKEMC
ncbi:MAG: HDIG domain-containing protein [Candidatus Bathyarchaeia archaeon]